MSRFDSTQDWGPIRQAVSRAWRLRLAVWTAALVGLLGVLLFVSLLSPLAALACAAPFVVWAIVVARADWRTGLEAGALIHSEGLDVGWELGRSDLVVVSGPHTLSVPTSDIARVCWIGWEDSEPFPFQNTTIVETSSGTLLRLPCHSSGPVILERALSLGIPTSVADTAEFSSHGL